MRFSKVRMTGFKSFVDPTELFVEAGLTGIVGPNGCGKSNLLEALRWAMGESRPTSMRGSGMEDVIFAGTASRPARHFAEVAIHLDNAERLAPAAFNDSDHLEIIRRITRDAGSAYKVNGKDMRARDVQMLFADASTGSHSPALVRQGQIASLINAKPRERRRILEEAAGISGLYQRRHEAELKLSGAETNLGRVDEVIDQLATQLQQLARQARQAARYRAIADQLTQAEGLLLCRRWKDADQAVAETAAELARQSAQTARAESAALEADKARAAAEEALPPLRERDAESAAGLQRLLVARDALQGEEAEAARRVEALQARIGQLAHDIRREEDLDRDASESIKQLDWEAEQLAKADQGHETKLAEAEAEAQEAAAALARLETELGEITEDVARLAARHQSAQRRVEDGRRDLETGESEAEAARSALTEARSALERTGADCTEAAQAESDAAAAAEAAERALEAADAAVADAQTREGQARADRSAAEGEAGALAAEISALDRLVERDSGGADPVLNAISVEPGYERALGAALADDLRAPETAADSEAGWSALPDYPQSQPLPEGVEPIAGRVRGPAALARRLSQIGVVDAAEARSLQAGLRPGQRLVSLDGGLWRWDGYRAPADAAPSEAALQLQRANRLDELKAGHAAAAQRAAETAGRHDELREVLGEAAAAAARAREARRGADAAASEANRAHARAEAERSLARSRAESLDMAVSRHDAEARAARERLTEAEGALAGLDDLDTARARSEDIKTAVEAARMLMMTKRATHSDLRSAGEARIKRAQEVKIQKSDWSLRREQAVGRAAELAERREASEAELAEARAVPDQIAQRREELAAAVAEAEAARAKSADALSAAEGAARESVAAERAAERAAGDARESRARAQALAEAAEAARSEVAARIREERETTPETLLEQIGADADDLPEDDAIEADVNRLKRQRDALGAINLRAEEDAREVQQEHDQLLSEKTDLESAIDTLRRGIAALNREGRERLLTAFEQVNANFRELFGHLFGGGEANLVMVESDDPLEAGLEIMCQPPGKKLATLSLLSGGEQTLTAVAIIFAVFLANPSPICVLDEVDAPLDDANVGRFCDLLDEMRRRTETRFLIITHHAITMSRMDRLMGVTMAEQGVSQLVSVDLGKAEALVA